MPHTKRSAIWVRREAAKKDQLRAAPARQIPAAARRPATAMTPWTQRHLTWVRQVQFEQPAQEATRLDYLHEVDMGAIASTGWSGQSMTR